MNLKLSLFLLLTISVLVACKKSNKDQNKKEKPPPLVDVLIAGQQEIPIRLEVNGTVVAFDMIEIHPEASGRITWLNMPDGAFVQEGTLLAKLNNEELQAQLEQQKSQLALATKTEQRLKGLLKVNGVNQAEYDAALNQMNVLEASVKITSAQLEKTLIKAPFSGKLGLRQVSAGAYVTPQTIMGSLSQSDKVKIDFSVPETRVSLVKPGTMVELKPNGSEKTLTAQVIALEPSINTESRNVNVRALLNSGNLYPGSFVKVYIDQTRTGINVPTNAIIPDALANQLVVVEGGKAVFRNVETGNRSSKQVEILSGINIGDSVVVSGMLFVRPGAPVKVRRSMNAIP
jgi:membrane fusion protein (multidrug efflux system)